MRYETFATAAAAQACVAQHQASGRRSYALYLRAACYQVRSWT